MQVDPIKPTLKAPGSKRLNPFFYELLSSFAFKSNLRRYTWDPKIVINATKLIAASQAKSATSRPRVQRCKSTVSKPGSKLPIVSGRNCLLYQRSML